MSENKKASSKNPLTVPLILSLCMNLVLIVAIVVMAVTASKVGTATESTASESVAVTETAEETDSDEKATTSYFENADGEQVEVVAEDDVYINTASYICAGDESEWNFTYDADTKTTTVEVVYDDTSATYTIEFYVTTDEDDARLVAQLVNEDGDAAALCYLSNLVDDDDNTLGMVMEMVNDSDEKILLCTPEYWETYQAQMEESSDDSETAEETETPEETETAE